ncbi:hypothetical protein DJ568_04840 [Mucilaginibacter hurinus]|uniref:Peptidase S24/S26A/S26B/S26C domain-containing protein n=1 Tax=Mucilaginibacter hurinus TaxID=2201324 RepID=A0A367GTA7_9SPHI|nr:S24 family peptidase [Mucilaginibacter hurinus]RCH56076.1 hypothetical protein DJ568_04840 [Mucilaginibacter hurinus]
MRLKKQRTKRDVLGFRLPMLTHEEPELDITDITVMDPDNTFFMRMGSEAMRSYNILPDNILVIDRSLRPVAGSIVVFYHEEAFFTREYCPQPGRLMLKADNTADTITIEQTETWTCWGVVMLTLNPVLPAQLRTGRYANVCAC